MVKTLRITTIAAALLAIAVFTLLIMYGVKTDENANKFLNSPGIVETFKAAPENKTHTITNQIHPLVQQAQNFAQILNPPKPVVPETGLIKPAFGKSIADLQAKNTPKFTLKSTSYYEQNPQMSLALIDEPGKGTYWVKQSSTVNHLFIEQIKDGVVIVRNGEESFPLYTPEKKAAPSLPKGKFSTSKNVTPVIRPERPEPLTTRPNITRINKTEPDTDRAERVAELVNKIKQIGAETEDPNINELSTEERAARMQKLIAEFKNSNMNISEEESQRLSDLGEMLENATDDESGN